MKKEKGTTFPQDTQDQKEPTSLLIKYFNMTVKFHLWRHCKKLTVTVLKGEKKVRRPVTDVPLANAPSLTLLTAHKHFHQFEILEALHLPIDAKCKCSFWIKYNFARCLC